MKRTAELKRVPLKRAEPVKEPKRRLRKCAVCRTPFQPRSMTHKACKPECAAQLVAQEKAKADRKDTRARLAKLKTRSDWLKDAQRVFNTYCRERDLRAGLPCICCGVPFSDARFGGAVDAGHYRSVGSAPFHRFNEVNCHAQAKKCNRFGAGRAVDYRIGLIAKIGLAAVEALEADNTPRKWSIDDLKAIKAHYTQKLKKLRETA
jgi:hypothetical protein